MLVLSHSLITNSLESFELKKKKKVPDHLWTSKYTQETETGNVERSFLNYTTQCVFSSSTSFLYSCSRETTLLAEAILRHCFSWVRRYQCYRSTLALQFPCSPQENSMYSLLLQRHDARSIATFSKMFHLFCTCGSLFTNKGILTTFILHIPPGSTVGVSKCFRIIFSLCSIKDLMGPGTFRCFVKNIKNFFLPQLYTA